MKKLDFAVRLTLHLEGIRQQVEYGEESPVYKRWDTIRQRIMEKRQLPVPAEADLAGARKPAVETTAPSPASAPTADVARFRKQVEVAVKVGKGALPATLAASLDVQRKSIGLTEAAGQQVIQEVIAAFGQPKPLETYRQTFAQFLAAGPIGDDERFLLTQLLLDSGLDPDEVDRIENEELAKAGKAYGKGQGA